MGLKQVVSKSQGNETIWAYSLQDILEINPLIALIYGKRSNGKTYAGAELILDDYIKTGMRGVWVRRTDIVFKDPKVKGMFNPLIEEGMLNNTIWTGIEYKQEAWWLYYYDEDLDKKIFDKEPFCYAANIALAESRKGGNYNNVHYVCVDEFISRDGAYLGDEPILFANLMSTIVRYQDKARFLMFANTVNIDSPYFDAFGIDPRKIKPGEIALFENAEGDKLAVEYVESKQGVVSKSDRYFGFFKSKRVQMITQGTWEMASYPRLPEPYTSHDVYGTFYILWKTEFLACDVVSTDKSDFIYIYNYDQATDDDDLIFCPMEDSKRNWHQNILTVKGYSVISRLIKENKIFYEDDTVGEIVRNYLKFCSSYTIIKS